jgi:L-alanine-DL-glutamate epimerase-like enolase superfamily enzyme
VFDVIAALSPQLIGQDPLMRRELLIYLERSNIPGRVALVRALSAIDIALWDLAAKAAGLPLYQMLGGYRRQVPVMAVAGYFGDVRSVEDIEDEVRQLADSGFRQIKLIISGTNPRADYELMSRLRKAVDASIQLAVDAHWTWHNLEEALCACRMLDEVGLSFIEDPFTPQQWRLTRELRKMIRTPLAMGEDVVDIQGFRDLLEGVTILRGDATASGGVTGLVSAIDVAGVAGRSVIPHVFTSLHGQLGGWSPTISFVETILPATGADPINRLLARGPNIVDGNLVLGLVKQ